MDFHCRTAGLGERHRATAVGFTTLRAIELWLGHADGATGDVS